MWPFIPGERFPYANFHSMNQDWILQVIYEFKQQYSTIDQAISDGVTQLENTAGSLESNMQSIINNAINQLNNATTQKLNQFEQGANERANNAIASIPADYTEFYNAFKGVYIDESYMTEHSYSSFIQLTPGDYLCYFASPLTYSLPSVNSFYMHVSDRAFTSGYAYKTFYILSNNGTAYFAVCGGSSSVTNPPRWHELITGNIYGTLLDINSVTHYFNIPAGKYFVLLNSIGQLGFPTELGLSFTLDVSNKAYTNTSAFKTFIAYANNGFCMYAVCGNASSEINPPKWHELTNHEYTIPKFDTALEPVKLLLLGDSITAGSGATECSGSETFTTALGTQTIYDTGNSWAIKFADYLAEQYPNIEVINHGWKGITLGQLATNIGDFVPAGTTHCIIGLGINSEGSTSFDSSIKTIIDYLRNQGIKIYAWTGWLGTHPNMQNINTAGRVQAALVHAYLNVGIEPLLTYSLGNRYIEDHNLNYMDVMQYQPGNEIVHPNDLGHEILYRIIKEGFGF